MQIHTHTKIEATAYATVRLSSALYKDIRRHFRADEEALDADVVHIGRGTFLVKQGYGWYRIVNYSGANLSHRILWAVEQIRKWYAAYDAHRAYMIRQFLGLTGPRPASTNQLHRLVQKYKEIRV